MGKFQDYSDEIRQSYELGFPPCRLHTNVEGVFVTPIHAYSGRLDDVATAVSGDRQNATDKISSGGVALPRDRGPFGTRGLKGDSGDIGDTTRWKWRSSWKTWS